MTHAEVGYNSGLKDENEEDEEREDKRHKRYIILRPL